MPNARLFATTFFVALSLGFAPFSLKALPCDEPPCEPCCLDDAQAYCASALVPALRPQVVIGALAAITVVAILLINGSNSHHH